MQTLLNKIKNHIEHWKKVNNYDCDFDYHGLDNIINSHLQITDEEISKCAPMTFSDPYIDQIRLDFYIRGAIWLRDKIKNK